MQLYRLFAQWERRERVAAREIGERGDFALAVENRLRGREREISNREAEQTQRTQLSRLLNLPGVDITPVAGSRPKLDYSSRLPSLIPGDNYGRLATRLSAYELEAALLRQRGLRFQRWPVPTFSAGTPAIYDSDRGSGGWIESADEISLFGSWGKSFDLTGREAATLRSAEEHVGFVRDNMRVRLDTEAAQWRRLQSRYRLVMERRALLAARVEAARRQGGGRASVQLEEFRRLSMELAEVEQRKEELDVEIWLWDDQAWK